MRIGGACTRNLSGNGKRDGKDEHARGVIFIHFLPNDDSLRSKYDEAQCGQLNGVRATRVD